MMADDLTRSIEYLKTVGEVLDHLRVLRDDFLGAAKKTRTSMSVEEKKAFLNHAAFLVDYCVCRISGEKAKTSDEWLASLKETA